MKCWPFFHRWAKWETTIKGELWSKNFDQLTGNPATPGRCGFWEKQRRECEKCGKCQLRIAKT